MTTSVEVPTGFEFWRKQLDRLGDRPPIPVLEATAGALRDHLAAAGSERWTRSAGEGVWTPADVAGHLFDVEWIFGFRTRTSAFDVDAGFPDCDQNRWVEEQREKRPPLPELIEHFARLRAANLALWVRLCPADLDRTGRHLGAGVSLSVGTLLRILAGHDLGHLQQVHDRLA